jgi:hypothetical protein
VDADLKSITKDWVKFLLGPIFEGYDYVTPIYSRHKYDGTITNMICYPLLYGLVGLNVRQPIGGDFSFSGKLADYWLNQRWYPTTGMYGIDIFMTTHAVFGNFRIAQTGLGAKIHKPSAPKLSDMFVQVVSTLFENLLNNKKLWSTEVQETKRFGLKNMDAAQNLQVDKEKIKKTALFEYDEELAQKYLSNTKISNMFNNKQLKIDAELWSRCVYDMLNNFRKNRIETVKCLRALYFARVYSFIEHTENLDGENAEKEILDQAKIFRKNRGLVN